MSHCFSFYFKRARFLVLFVGVCLCVMGRMVGWGGGGSLHYLYETNTANFDVNPI